MLDPPKLVLQLPSSSSLDGTILISGVWTLSGKRRRVVTVAFRAAQRGFFYWGRQSSNAPLHCTAWLILAVTLPSFFLAVLSGLCLSGTFPLSLKRHEDHAFEEKWSLNCNHEVLSEQLLWCFLWAAFRQKRIVISAKPLLLSNEHWAFATHAANYLSLWPNKTTCSPNLWKQTTTKTIVLEQECITLCRFLCFCCNQAYKKHHFPPFRENGHKHTVSAKRKDETRTHHLPPTTYCLLHVLKWWLMN